MSRQMLISLGLLLLVFGSGVALGLYMGSAPPASDVSKKSSDESSSGTFSETGQERIEANTLLSDRIRELDKELAEQKKDQKTILADRMAFFKKYNKSIRVSAFDGGINVTPEMVEILGLSKEEQQAI